MQRDPFAAGLPTLDRAAERTPNDLVAVAVDRVGGGDRRELASSVLVRAAVLSVLCSSVALPQPLWII